MTHFQRVSGLIVLALLAYALPWIANTSTPLTMGAYDLAEWASIHPVARISEPTMLVSLLLRLPLVFMAIIVGFAAPTPPLRVVGWWVALIAVLIITASSLPPLEFFTGGAERSDPNYQQQFYLTIAACVGGFAGLTGLLPKARPYVAIVAAVGAIAVSIDGINRSISLMDWMNLSAGISNGLILYVIVMILVTSTLLVQGINTQKKQQVN